jgi:hypothetical protein
MSDPTKSHRDPNPPPLGWEAAAVAKAAAKGVGHFARGDHTRLLHPSSLLHPQIPIIPRAPTTQPEPEPELPSAA